VCPAEPIGDVLRAGAVRLERAGVAAARHDAELLLAHLLDTDRGGLFLRRADTLDAAVARTYSGWIRRRAAREPLQHVTRSQEFYGLSLLADGRALVPRPETEGLVQAALDLAPARDARVVDLGTGSGCIAVALAVQRPDLQIRALDRSPAALTQARENAARHAVEERIELFEGDLGRPPDSWHGTADLVVSNPPYVTEADWRDLEPEVREHDPREALVAGPTGLEAYRALAPAAFALLRAEGHLVLELGFGAARSVREIVSRAGFEVVEVRPDLRGIPRVLVAARGRS
jgi:release factor glutamine methyltransferase